MKAFILCALGLATFRSAIPSQYEDDLVFRRAVNEHCKAPLGTGSCQHKSQCPGISYPTGLCPKDPDDVQCCVKQICTVPSVGSGYCRSVNNNGCSGGLFHTGFCPGNSDIKCCIKTTTTPTPPPSQPPTPPPNPCQASTLETLLFQNPISTFTAAKTVQTPSCFDWHDDGCSCSPDDLGEYDFLPSCWRHDFGYRNTKAQGSFTPEMKERIDSNFKKDLYDVCGQFSGLQSYKGVECRRIADIYVYFVRKFGKKMKRKRDGMGLQKRECDLKDAVSGLFGD